MIAKRLDALAIGLLTLLCINFGLQQIAIKFALEGISPVMQAGLRSIGAAALLMLWMRYKGEKIWRRDGAELWGILAGLLFAAEFLLLYIALEYTGAARATIFLYTSPFVVAIGAQILLPTDRMRPAHFFGMMCAFVGVVLAFSDKANTSSIHSLMGDLLALGAAILWGATTLVIKASPQAASSPARILLYQLGISAVILPVASVLMGEQGIFMLDQSVTLAMLFQIVVVAFLSYLGWFWLIRHYQASRIATFSFMTPMFGVLFAWLILNEPLSLDFALALGLVAAGIYLVNRR